MSQIQLFEPGTPGPGPILALAGNSGGSVPPDGAGVIDVLGGVGVTTVGVPGAHTLTINVTGGGFTWHEVVTPTVVGGLIANNGYIMNEAGGVIAILPAVAAIGDTIRILGKGAGGWVIEQHANQQMMLNIKNNPPGPNQFYSTIGVAGSAGATDQFDAIDLICIGTIGPNTIFKVIPLSGNINFL